MDMLQYKFAKTWLEEASDKATQLFQRVDPTIKGDDTYVTEADHAVQDFLIDKIEKRFPNVGIIAEEKNIRKQPKEGNEYFVIDPIDGTAAFVCGLPVWGIALGVIVERQPIAG